MSGTPAPAANAVYRTIAWEAAYCFSLALVGFAVRRAWPVNGLLPFFATVIAGATIALVVSHILPAVLARHILTPQTGPGRYMQSLVALWLSAGAALAFVLFAADQQLRFSYFPYDQKFRIVSAQIIIATLLIGVSAILLRLERIVAPVLTAASLIFAAASCIAHSPALHFTVSQLDSEALLEDNYAVLLGMISGSAPAAIFALQFGKQTPSRSAILWTGIFGMWLPMILSVSLMSFAKVFGARLYWKPSIPIDETYAYAFANSLPNIPPRLLFELAPIACVALWVRELLHIASPSRRNIAIVSVLLLSAVLALQLEPFSIYAAVRTWLWSIVVIPILFFAGKFLTGAKTRAGAIRET